MSAKQDFAMPYEASDFPLGSRYNGYGSLRVTWGDLLWATVSVGKSRFDLLSHGRHSVAEMIHRVSCIEAYFEIRHGRLKTTAAHQYLDPSEKGLVSYHLGMAAAKIYADRVLNVPWLMHVSRYQASWSVQYGANPDRPDLFGCNDQGEWLIAEAKGRTRVTGSLIQKMKQQKSAVATVNGATPLYRIGTATRFPAGELALRVVDPPESAMAEDVSINPSAWPADYYRPFVDLFQDGQVREEGNLVLARVPGSDLEVGLDVDMLQEVTSLRSRTFARPDPAPARQDGTRRDQNRRLDEQGTTEDREVVRRLGEAISGARTRWTAQPDGLVIRTSRDRRTP